MAIATALFRLEIVPDFLLNADIGLGILRPQRLQHGTQILDHLLPYFQGGLPPLLRQFYDDLPVVLGIGAAKKQLLLLHVIQQAGDPGGGDGR